MVLGKMKQTAEADLGGKVTHAVVTVPVSFNGARRRLPRTPVPSPGLTILRVVNEPTTALSPTVSTRRTPVAPTSSTSLSTISVEQFSMSAS
ncbi:hypothetical protein M407DRAFT_227797 [Tulasnella calospora MUT 4182]|uniref:Uncharacterized protein n=1 Tax=Tulasnella calospora MUT 4182 TaxID=1051891 RepID=A0A0C3Q4B9_9AGAM|nr:hypothetical protein M407DRAFT_227797 [Tulasnella calospora MUT 4182]